MNITKFSLLIIIFPCLMIQKICSQEIMYEAFSNGILSEEIDFKDYEVIDNAKEDSFQGEFGFGSSESEYELEVLHSKGRLYAREIYHPIQENGFGFLIERIPVTFIEGEILINKEMTYSLFKCIRNSINNKKGDVGIGYISIGKHDEQEVHSLSFHSKRGDIKIYGKYPETSFVKLKKDELQIYSSRELKIMRNEIFARNGHLFKQNGDMGNYFSKQTWYNQMEKTKKVDLSEIENHNVELIKSIE